GSDGIVFDGGSAAGSLVTVTTTNGGNVRLSGAVRLDSSLRLVTAGTSDGDVTFTNDAPVDSQSGEFNDLVLNAGTGVVRFNEDLGATQSLGLLTVEGASQVVFGQADTEAPGSGTTGPVNQINTDGAIDIGSVGVITSGIIFNGGANPLTITTTGDNVRLNGAVTLNSGLKIDTGSAVGGDITFTSNSPIDSQSGEHNDLTLNAGTGSIFFNGNIGAQQSIGNLIIDTAAGGVTFGGADVATTGAGGPVTIVNTDGPVDIGSGTLSSDVIGGTGITFNGGSSVLTVTTTGDNVRLNGAVTLNSGLKIDTGSGVAGDITFTANTPIDSQAGEHNSLTLNAGTGSVFFNGNIGTKQSIGSLIVDTAAGGVTFGGADVAATGASGPVTIVNTDGPIDIGSGTLAGDVIGGTGITFNGGNSLLTVTTTGDNVRLNGAVTLNNGLKIDTGSG